MNRPSAEEMFKLSGEWMFRGNFKATNDDIENFFNQHGWKWKEEYKPLLKSGKISIKEIKFDW